MTNRFLYVVTVLTWGTTWIAIEYQLGTVAPEVSVFYRYILAATLLFAWCWSRGLTLRFSLRDHAQFVLLGLFLFCLNYVLTYHAQQYITSALAAICFSTMLWMNIINSRIFFGARAGKTVVVGSIAGIAGIATLFFPQIESLSLTDVTLFGASLCIAGAYLASLGNMVSQSAQNRGLPIVQSNAWGMLYGAIVTGVIAVAQGKTFILEWSAGYMISLLYLAVVGSIVGFGAYLTLLGRIGANKAGYAMVMFPVVALVVSIFFEGLEPGWNILMGVALVIAGNVLILRTTNTNGVSQTSPDHRKQLLSPASCAPDISP